MANTPPRQMSLITYPNHNGEVVLRRGNDVVVYDAQSHSLTVRNTSEDAVELNECPYCHRPFREDADREKESGRGRPGSGYRERSYVDPEYFGMLAASQRPSPSSSAGPSTPIKRFFQPALRSGRSREVSGTSIPPSDAEFVSSEPSASARNDIDTSSMAFKQHFREIRELGRGGNGVVLLVEHVMAGVSLGQFACKRVPVGNDHDWLQKVLVEHQLLRKIPHKNLVAYHWAWLENHQPSTFGPSIPCLWMLQEFCNGGDLHTYVLGPKEDADDTKEKLKERARRHSRGDMEPPQLRGPSKLTFDDIFSFFRDITSGLHHLHSKGYIHRDLKPSNCLIQKDGGRLSVLISDFGEVQAMGTARGSTGATGTISYCAPEVLQQDASSGSYGDFTTKSDIFSLGMIVYFMCFGRLPYSSADDINEEMEDMEELRAEITKWPGFDGELRTRPDLPDRLYRYLKRLLSVDPSERPSTDEILASIKGGAGLGDVAAVMSEDASSAGRVSAIDSPRRRVSPQRRNRPQGYISRPGLSSIAKHMSENDIRPTSAVRRRTPTSTPTSPVDDSLTRAGPPSPPSRHLSSPHLSPKLLPAPPGRSRALTARVTHAAHHPITLLIFRTTLFVGKLLSLTMPCTPFVASGWVLYPLLAVAALDLLLRFDVRRSLLLLSAHVTVVVLAAQNGRLCQFRGPDDWLWNDLSMEKRDFSTS